MPPMAPRGTPEPLTPRLVDKAQHQAQAGSEPGVDLATSRGVRGAGEHLYEPSYES